MRACSMTGFLMRAESRLAGDLREPFGISRSNSAGAGGRPVALLTAMQPDMVKGAEEQGGEIPRPPVERE